jgi:hypothetical protein
MRVNHEHVSYVCWLAAIILRTRQQRTEHSTFTYFHCVAKHLYVERFVKHFRLLCHNIQITDTHKNFNLCVLVYNHFLHSFCNQFLWRKFLLTTVVELVLYSHRILRFDMVNASCGKEAVTEMTCRECIAACMQVRG